MTNYYGVSMCISIWLDDQIWPKLVQHDSDAEIGDGEVWKPLCALSHNIPWSIEMSDFLGIWWNLLPQVTSITQLATTRSLRDVGSASTRWTPCITMLMEHCFWTKLTCGFFTTYTPVVYYTRGLMVCRVCPWLWPALASGPWGPRLVVWGHTSACIWQGSVISVMHNVTKCSFHSGPRIRQDRMLGPQSQISI